MASRKPGSINRKKPSYKGTVKGAVQFALNPKRAIAKEVMSRAAKNFSTGGLAVAGNANSRRARQAGER